MIGWMHGITDTQMNGWKKDGRDVSKPKTVTAIREALCASLDNKIHGKWLHYCPFNIWEVNMTSILTLTKNFLTATSLC